MFSDKLFERRFPNQNRRRSSSLNHPSDQKDLQRTHSRYFIINLFFFKDIRLSVLLFKTGFNVENRGG